MGIDPAVRGNPVPVRLRQGGDGGQPGEKGALSGDEVGQPGEKEAASRDDSGEGKSAPEKVVMTYQVTKGSIIDDLEDVERAVNEVSVPAIGVEVEFKVIDAQEAFSRYPLWISNREPVDLMVLNYQDITRYVDRGMLRSLDDILYEYGTDIRTVSEERYDLTRGRSWIVSHMGCLRRRLTWAAARESSCPSGMWRRPDFPMTPPMCIRWRS